MARNNDRDLPMTGEIDQLREKLAGLFDRLKKPRVLVVGDVMLDTYVEGSVLRTAPDNHVEILAQSKLFSFPGGAANVAMNAAGMGAEVVLAGVIGEDPEAELLLDRLERGRVSAAKIVRVAGRPTTLKQRFNAGSRPLLRVDREVTSSLPDCIVARLCDQLAEPGAAFDAIIVSDYAKGVVGPRLFQAVLDCARRWGAAVLVDPKGENFVRYAGASFVTPNADEMAAAGIDPSDIQALRGLAEALGCEGIILTQGAKGARLVTRELDVTFAGTPVDHAQSAGAGDTFIAMLAIALASGLPVAEGIPLANLAAGEACSMPHTATVTLEALRREREMDEPNKPFDQIASWRGLGLRVGFTNGCFDVLHAGHVHLLAEARRRCDRLVVGLNTDDSVRRLKGAGRPVHTLADRLRMLLSMRDVDLVLPFSEATPQRLIETIRPDVLVKGADYALETVVGADTVMAYGGQVLLVELVPGLSTSAVLRHAERERG